VSVDQNRRGRIREGLDRRVRPHEAHPQTVYIATQAGYAVRGDTSGVGRDEYCGCDPCVLFAKRKRLEDSLAEAFECLALYAYSLGFVHTDLG
jgi:hypothetical protein